MDWIGTDLLLTKAGHSLNSPKHMVSLSVLVLHFLLFIPQNMSEGDRNLLKSSALMAQCLVKFMVVQIHAQL